MQSMVSVGDTIRIIHLIDEPQPYNNDYNGKTGVVKGIEVDPWGDTRMQGTWGGVFVYINKDEYEILKK